MKKIFNLIKSIRRETIIKNSFLLPILLVVLISISHVIRWYDIGNPMSWAIYLSIAIEIFALASVSAASINISRFSVWALFGLVTSIQIIGNIFFSYQEIDVNGRKFVSWVELIQPWFEDWSLSDHRRFLAIIQGGTLPLMSLIALHYYIKFNDIQKANKKSKIIEVKAETFPQEVLQKIFDNQEKNKTSLTQEISSQKNSSIDQEIPSTSQEITQNQEENLKTSEDKISQDEEISETKDEKPSSDTMIVKNIKAIAQDNSNDANEQWAGRKKHNTVWQNPQLIPGISKF